MLVVIEFLLQLVSHLVAHHQLLKQIFVLLRQLRHLPLLVLFLLIMVSQYLPDSLEELPHDGRVAAIEREGAQLEVFIEGYYF